MEPLAALSGSEVEVGIWGGWPLLGPFWGRCGSQRGSGGLCGVSQVVLLRLVCGRCRAAPSE